VNVCMFAYMTSDMEDLGGCIFCILIPPLVYRLYLFFTMPNDISILDRSLVVRIYNSHN
jgi:hypothetical protein